jgi:hypothetical protein
LANQNQELPLAAILVDQQVNILLSDDSIDLCNYFNDSQNNRSNTCNGSIEFIDDQFSPHNSSSM